MKPLSFLLIVGSAAALGGWRTEAASQPVVVRLPPFIVEAKAIPLPWKYAEFGRFRVLSLCADETTQEFIHQLSGLEQQVEWIIPSKFRFVGGERETYVICDESTRSRLDLDILRELSPGQGSHAARPLVAAGQPVIESFPNIVLHDEDEMVAFAFIDPRFLAEHQLGHLPGYMEYLLRARAPPLPVWFVSGFTYLYERLSFGADDGLEVSAANSGPVGVTAPPFVWLSKDEDRILRRPGPWYSPLLPMEDLFGEPRLPPGMTAAGLERYRSLWICQAALFVRWALDDHSDASRRAFWQYLERCSVEPATEELFKNCFGMNYAQIRSHLGLYLRRANQSAQLDRWAPAVNPGSIRVRPASPAEVAFLKGDWERLEAEFVERTYPKFAPAYFNHAHATLWRAYDAGERSPALLAAMGLLACDQADFAAAQPLLAAAAQQHKGRPKVNFELARILYDKGLAQPRGRDGRLDREQTSAVLEPLIRARRQAPPLEEVWALLVELWSHSDLSPSPADLVDLENGSQLFPEDSRLSSASAELCLRGGAAIEAGRIIDRALAHHPDSAARDRLLLLQARH